MNKAADDVKTGVKEVKARVNRAFSSSTAMECFRALGLCLIYNLSNVKKEMEE